MLDPIYYTRVEATTNSDTGLTEYRIADRALDNGLTYKITQYAKVGIYVKVSWVLSGSEDMTGETLWRDRTPIASDGGRMRLFTFDSSTQAQGMSQFPVSVWDTISEDVGVYGVPVQIARALRDPKNTVILS